jgi:hypothetical protein
VEMQALSANVKVPARRGQGKQVTQGDDSLAPDQGWDRTRALVARRLSKMPSITRELPASASPGA